jgi:flagellar hook-associated protein 1 FlgK
MSTFGGLSVAYSGLAAARAGIDTVGQNMANVNTEGYTRQRVSTTANAALAGIGPLDNAVRAGQGVTVNSIDRLGDILLESRVRQTAGSTGFANMTAAVMDALEVSLSEPGDNGLAATMHEFWAAWQNVANHAGEPSSTGVLLEAADALTSRIAQGYTDAVNTWSVVRDQTDSMVAQVNSLAGQVASLNDQIRQVGSAGGSTAELIDQRNLLTVSLATLAGATTTEHADGTVDVLVGGNALVAGTIARSLVVTGAHRLEDANAMPVSIEWSHRPGESAAISGGALAAAAVALAPGSAAGGGSIVFAAESYNALATQLATAVNAVHVTGATPAGVTGLAFFALDATRPAALGLSVIPTDASGVAAGTPGAGGSSGSVADAIAAIGGSDTGPDTTWSDFVVRIGIDTRRAANDAAVAARALTSAQSRLLSEASVDLDEETTNLLTYQHAYQGAARMVTAIDEMLDTLINRTGLVGR